MSKNQNKPSTFKEGDNYQITEEVRWVIRGKKHVLQQACVINPYGPGEHREDWVDVPVVNEE